MCTTGAQNPLPYISALHRQGVSTVVEVVFSKWSVACSTVAHLHTY
jgi:hypothetical protein